MKEKEDMLCHRDNHLWEMVQGPTETAYFYNPKRQYTPCQFTSLWLSER